MLKQLCRLGVSCVCVLLACVAFARVPDNDAFASAIATNVLPVSLFGSNHGATLEPGEQVPDESAQASVWFDWTAPVSGPLRIDTAGSDFDTLLAVWAGDTFVDLALVAANDDFQGVQSEIQLDATAGVTYHIAVYGYGKYRGNVVLNIGQDTGGRIAGTVTGNDEAPPLEGIRVKALKWAETGWELFSETATDLMGAYFLTGLSAGIYRVQFCDDSGAYVTEWHSNARDAAKATDILISEMVTADGVDAILQVAGHINGRVTADDGTTPLANIHVSAIRTDAGIWEWGWDVWSDANGNYSIGGLPSGAYMVRFLDDSGVREYEMFEESESFAESRKVTVTAGGTLGGIDATLGFGASVAGVVTAPDESTPVQGVGVQVLRFNGSWWETWNGAQTDETGYYRIDGLRPGTYRVRFNDLADRYAAEVYDDASTVTDGADVTVARGEALAGINASLGQPGSIAGTVTGPDGKTPLGGIDVCVDQWNGSRWEDEVSETVVTETNGTYRMSGLAAGVYRIRFLDNQQGRYVSEVFDNRRIGEQGSNIVLEAGMALTNADASLDAAARISGSVTGSDNVTPLDGIEVSAWRWEGEWFGYMGRVWTDPNGGYTLAGLLPGTYQVRFDDPNGYYYPEVYQGARYVGDGTDILAEAAVTVTNIDVSLELAARIEGFVTGPDGVTPIAGIRVIAETPIEWEGNFRGFKGGGGAVTDENGRYAVGGLMAGKYVVTFRDDAGVYAMECYDDARSFYDATGLVVRAQQTITNINASLDPESRITGTVTGADGITPLAGVDVQAFVRVGNDWMVFQGTSTDSDGTYSLGGLKAGVYRILFRDPSGAYAFETYAGAAYPEEGVDVAVGVAETVSGINASLDPASRISGSVTDSDGASPLPGIWVAVYRWNGEDWTEWANTTTDEAGCYEVAGLRAGTYRVFFGGDGLHAYEVYDDEDWVVSGTDVELSSATVRSGIDASLGPASAISGVVTDGADGKPLREVLVGLYRWSGGSWAFIGFVMTDDAGRFSCGGLSAGTYRIGFRDLIGDYAFKVFGESGAVETGASIIVPVAQAVDGVNVSLWPVGTLVPARITGLRCAEGGAFEIRFLGATGQRYVLQESAALGGAWFDVGKERVCGPGTNSISTDVSVPTRFWRLLTLP